MLAPQQQVSAKEVSSVAIPRRLHVNEEEKEEVLRNLRYDLCSLERRRARPLINAGSQKLIMLF